MVEKIDKDIKTLPSIRKFAEKQILTDLKKVIENPSLTLKAKKEKILEIAKKDYSIEEKLENLKFPEELKNYDIVDLGFYSYFFKEYNVPLDDVTPQNIEEKLKVLIRNIYNEGIRFIKNIQVFMYIDYLKNTKTDEEIKKIIDNLEYEVNFYLKRTTESY